VTAVLIFSSENLFVKKMTFCAFFDTSLNGLDVGAPVKFKGVRVGGVEAIEIIYDNETDEAITAVIFNVNANLFKTIKGRAMRVEDHNAFYAEQIGRGLAARLSTESFLTGKLYVDLNYYDGARRRFSCDVDMKRYLRMPSVSTELDEFIASFDTTMKKLSKIDFEKISQKTVSLLDTLDGKIKSLNLMSMVKGMDAIADVLSFDSDIRQSMSNLLQQFSKTLRSLRVFLDFIERNPNALITGRVYEN
jgi:paraquat-inducible protein B